METLMRRHGGVGWALANDVREVPPMIRQDSAAVRRAWSFVDRQRTEAGYAFAAGVLESHPNVNARVLAATILRQAPAGDALLHTLVRAMRDEADMVGSIAGHVAERMAGERGEVDWTPVVEDVHALLDGSSLYALDEMMNALRNARVDERWAAPFLAGGGHAVLARLGAENERMWRPAHRLLVALRGEDLGRDPAAWRTWIDSLRPLASGG
jgi:hypothetical protein